MRVLACIFALFLAILPRAVMAQDTATLVADQVTLNGENSITATGNVEIFFDGARLRAHSVTYYATSDSLDITGPIQIVYPDGTTLAAESATLDSDLSNGIMQSARLVLDQQLQIAAAEVNRISGRYTQIYKSVASSCKICTGTSVPLWEIRARKITHDQLERQLYFENAQLRIANVPVFYLPRLRLPDPTQDRATGFLIPTASSDSSLGTGAKLPYFITISPDKDLTLTPYLTGKTRTVELRYRQAFRNGGLQIDGALSEDDLSPGIIRSYVFAKSNFNLSRDYVLNLDLRLASDSSYLSDYSYDDTDRLISEIELTRTRRDQYFSAQLTHFRSFRSSESNDTIPAEVVEVFLEQRFQPSLIGGNATAQVELFGFQRSSSIDGENGRDMGRFSTSLGWDRDWMMRNGMITTLSGALNADYYVVNSDSAYPKSQAQLTPSVALELRWPWQKSNAMGVTHVIEPVMQLVWTDLSAADVPNEDSSLVEFDEGNLFSFTRFPGSDAYEHGLRANLGVTWTRYDPSGWSLGITVGRILRADDLGQFASGTGLAGQTSDWLAAAQLKLPQNLTLSNRALFDDNLSFTKSETLLSWQRQGLSLATGYIWMVAQPDEDRDLATSEWTMDATYRMARHWTGSVDWRFDFIAGQAASAGLGLEYRNECVRVDFSVSRRFTSSTSVDPSTRYGFELALLGFGTSGSGQDYSRSCARFR